MRHICEINCRKLYLLSNIKCASEYMYSKGMCVFKGVCARLRFAYIEIINGQFNWNIFKGCLMHTFSLNYCMHKRKNNKFYKPTHTHISYREADNLLYLILFIWVSYEILCKLHIEMQLTNAQAWTYIQLLIYSSIFI